MTILDPVVASNLAVYLVQLPRGRATSRKQSTAPRPVEFTSLESARAIGEVVVSETGATERVRLANHSDRDLFIQAGEVLRGGDQDRAVAGDLIIPAPRHEPESHLVPAFCAEPERSVPMRGWTPDQFTLFDQTCPGRRLKKELRLGTQEDVWREITAMRDVVFDLVSHGGTGDTPPYSLWTLIELLETQGWLNEYINVLLPLAEANMKTTGAVFVLGGRFNSAELYAILRTRPDLFADMQDPSGVVVAANFNPYHDQLGRFTTSDDAVAPHDREHLPAHHPHFPKIDVHGLGRHRGRTERPAQSKSTLDTTGHQTASISTVYHGKLTNGAFSESISEGNSGTVQCVAA